MIELSVLAILLGALAGCDQVFGLEGRQSEGEVPVTITDLEILGTPPTILDTRDVRANIHGPAGSRQTYAWTAAAGTLVPAAGVIDLDGNGDAAITSSYQADTSGMITLTAMAASAEATVTFEVIDLDVVGRDSGNSSVPVQVDLYIGSKVNLASPGELRGLGLTIMVGTASNAKFAVYRDDNGQPANRIVDLSTALPLTLGRNMFPTSPMMLAAGDYWIIGIFDQTTNVIYEHVIGTLLGSVAGRFTDPMPETVSGFVVESDIELAYFLLVVPQ